MAKQERYFIGPSLLSDIRETITRVDAIAPKTSGAAQPVRLQDLQRPGMRLSRGTFTGTWNVGETKAVTIQGSTDTASVTNYCIPVISGNTNATETLTVIFGSVMGTVSAVEIQQPTCTLSIGSVDLTGIPGYDSNVTQLLGHSKEDTNSTACFGLQWFSTVTCSTSAVSPNP